MKIASTKDNILTYIEYKGITKAVFFEMTGIKRGFLDSDKLKQAVSDDHLTKILAVFPDLNILWLLTGKGSMINHTETSIVAEHKETYSSSIDYKAKYYEVLEKYYVISEELRKKK